MNDILEKVKAPAAGLIVVGVLNGVTGILTLLGGLVRMSGVLGPEDLPLNEAERVGFMIGTIGGYGIAFVSLLAAPIIFYGGLQMLKGRSYKLAKTSAVFAIVPLVSCCFIAGIPLGVWALMVLNRPDVRAAFDGQYPFATIDPPLPPRF